VKEGYVLEIYCGHSWKGTKVVINKGSGIPKKYNTWNILTKTLAPFRELPIHGKCLHPFRFYVRSSKEFVTCPA
jgi:hypothetical protein